MKTLVKLILLVSLFACNSVYSQNSFSYKKIPSYIKAKYIVSDDERAKAIVGIPNLYDLTKSLPDNYVKDGSVDYTDYIQKGIDENPNVIFPDFPVLVNDKGISLKSNSNVVFAKNSKVILQPTQKFDYQIIRMHRTNNVKLYYPVIVGDRDGHLGKGGEFGMGISIRNASDCEIYNAYVSNCWGDGIFFSDLSKNITLYNPVVDNNRRNGISVVFADGVKIYNMLSSNTNGTAPESGIDIEPDHNYQEDNNILLESPITFNNKSRGILIAMKNFYGSAVKKVNVDINNHKNIGANYGIAFYLGSRKSGVSPLSGNIRITNPDWGGSKKAPIYMDSEMDANGINVQISNPKIGGIVNRNIQKITNGTKNVQIN